MKRIILVSLLLLALSALNAVWQINEDFEAGTIPTGWSVIDQDGDGNAWHVIQNQTHAHSGTKAAFVDNYMPHQNHDWLITPAIHVQNGDSLFFYTRAWISTENLKVKISTTGTAVSNFSTTLLTQNDIGVDYTQFKKSLSAYNGLTIYIAFFWECDNYGMLIDDVQIGTAYSGVPTMQLPSTMTFMQGNTLTSDFTQYITMTNPEQGVLSAVSNNVSVSIDHFTVGMTSPNWNGSESVVFTLTDTNSLTAQDTVLVTVTPPPVNDVAIMRVLKPQNMVYLQTPWYPSVVIKNLGNTAIQNVEGINCTIRNTATEAVYSQTMTYTGNIDPDQEATVTFAVPCVLTSAGQYSGEFTLNIVDGDVTNNTLVCYFDAAAHVGIGGPDTFGYHWIDSETEGGPAFNWIDISSTGQSTISYNVSSFEGDDNFSEPIDLGFSFNLYGTQYTHCYVDVNGEILFGQNSWYDAFPGNGWQNDGNVFNWMYPIPGYSQMPGLIAVYWDDLEADQGTGDVYFQTFGEAPNRYTIIQWHNIRFHSGTGGNPTLNFEVILNESGDIVCQYQHTTTGQTGTNAPHDYGKSATVAIQDQSAQMGLCYLREMVQGSTWVGIEPAGNILHDNLAIRFYTGNDIQPPVISHSAAGNMFDTNPQLTATISDMSPLSSVSLHYNIGEGWQILPYTALELNNYQFSLPTIPAGSEIRYYFEAIDSCGNTAVLPATAPTECFSFNILPSTGAEVLLACSGNQDYQHTEQPLYEAFLTQNGYVYDAIDWEKYNISTIPSQYKTVICYASTGSRSANMDSLCVALMRFMSIGENLNPKNVLFVSDGYAFNQGGLPNEAPMDKLMAAYFRTSYIATGSGGGSNGLAGPDEIANQNGTISIVAGSPIGEENDEIPIYANSPDCVFQKTECPSWYADSVVNPQIGSHNAFLFEDGPINGQAYAYHAACGTWIDNLIYKAFYFSFDLSQVTQQTDRDMILRDALVWFGTTTSNDNPTANNPVFSLMQNYPNPFNPQTSITFTNDDSKARTMMAIYNIKGEKVRVLMDGTLAKGEHKLVWDGKDDKGAQVASGVYFYRYTNGKHSQTRKMVLMK